MVKVDCHCATSRVNPCSLLINIFRVWRIKHTYFLIYLNAVNKNLCFLKKFVFSFVHVLFVVDHA